MESHSCCDREHSRQQGMARGSGEPPAKIARLEPPPLPANVIIQFQSDTGDTVGTRSIP